MRAVNWKTRKTFKGGIEDFLLEYKEAQKLSQTSEGVYHCFAFVCVGVCLSLFLLCNHCVYRLNARGTLKQILLDDKGKLSRQTRKEFKQKILNFFGEKNKSLRNKAFYEIGKLLNRETVCVTLTKKNAILHTYLRF